MTKIGATITWATWQAAFTWDALGRRIQYVNDDLGTTTRYYFDGVNELVEFDDSDARLRYYVHGVSYIDERLMMYRDSDSRPYYCVVDRMYNVRSVIDWAGAIVERYAYDSYGRPRIRESCGRGDMNQDSIMNSTDTTRFTDVKNGTLWDPRADMDDDGDVDASDQTAFNNKAPTWGGSGTPTVTVAQAFSDVGNPYMFQGVPHFALDTASNATEDKLSLNHHRARFADCPTGRCITRDPLDYRGSILFEVLLHSAPEEHAVRILLDRDAISIGAFDVVAMTATLFVQELNDPLRYLDPLGLKACTQTCSRGRSCCQTAGMPTPACNDTAPMGYAACMAIAGGTTKCWSDWSCTTCGGTCTICWPPWVTPCATSGTPTAPGGNWRGVPGTPAPVTGICVGDAPPSDYCDCPPGSW